VTHDVTEPRWSTVVAALGVAVCGLSGVAINQQAFRLGPLSASMPVLNVVSVCLAVVFGGVAFGDYPSLGTLAVAGQVVALVLIGIGLRVVAVDLDRDDVAARAD
jgi:glucose uptake protein GlcU